MSTKKAHQLRTLPQLPATPRWVPSTPHAIRALQQRSGGRRRSAITNRPDSARNILRQLAKITAAQTKRKPSTPPPKPSTPQDKENAYSPFISDGDEDLENGEVLERPDFTLPIEEIDEDGDGDGIAPIRQDLPGGDDYTFRSIDFAANHSRRTSVRSERIRRTSRFSILAFPEDEDEDRGQDDVGDLTAQSIEYGRRAVSEGPAWDRYPRSSFGSIRMSEFGFEESKLGKESEEKNSLIVDDHIADLAPDLDDNIEFDENDETQDLPRSRKSISEPTDIGISVPHPAFLDDEHTFRLDFDQQGPRSDSSEPDIETQGPNVSVPMADDESSEFFPQSPTQMHESFQETNRQMTDIEATVALRAPRRKKKMKLTRKGNVIPTLSSRLMKRIATDSLTRLGRKRPSLGPEHLAALEQATEWFFEQLGEDLEAYSNHSKRLKRIENSDVITLMKRQRVLGRGRSLEELTRDFLPDKVFHGLYVPDDT